MQVYVFFHIKNDWRGTWRKQTFSILNFGQTIVVIRLLTFRDNLQGIPELFRLDEIWQYLNRAIN